MIRVIVDSTCDMPAATIAQYGVEVLPLHVIAEGREYLDRVTITTREVYDMMRRGVTPKTAQVDLAETHRRLAELAAQGDDLLYLAFSSKMSGTCGLVAQIMESLKKQFPRRAMCTLDAKGGSFATGLIAMEAARAAAGGMAFDALVERCRFLIDHVEHVFVINDLTWMIRGGRISRTLGYTASLLDIKPVLDVSDGEMEVIQKVRGRRRSMERVADVVAQRTQGCPRQTIGVTHADDPQAAEDMRALLAKRLPECTFLTEEIGAVLGVHLGIGGVGVFFFNQM